VREGQWSWIGACSIGTSHLASGTSCDDAGACVEIETGHGPSLVAVVSDGAGSASLSRIGARIVTTAFCRSALSFFRMGGQSKDVDKELASQWLDEVRDRIGHASVKKNSARKSFAATLVGCLIQNDGIAVVHVGDGACAFQQRGDPDWYIPSWPSQGEYASTTNFVTDDPEPALNTIYIDADVCAAAVFSDGLERLALDFSTKKAFTPFFNSMFKTLRGEGHGRNRRLSLELRAFLDGPQIIQRTDDDKTLIMARRREQI
jgi:hypothetical protein